MSPRHLHWQVLRSVVQKTKQHQHRSAEGLWGKTITWRITSLRFKGGFLFKLHISSVLTISRRKEAGGFSAEVKHQQDNSVPQPKPINIPSSTVLSLLSDQHTHKLHWQPCWRSEINLPIVCAPWLHRDASFRNTIWFDCFGPTARKTTHRQTKTK